MIKGRSILAVIPARGGSKGVAKKNIRELAGKPLIAWTIEEAKKSKYIDRLIVSSDDHEIIEVAKRWGCEAPFIRPKELAQDDTPGVLPIVHAIEQLPEFDYVIKLQVTSPLRNVDDIDSCIENFVQLNAVSCASVSESKESPYWTYTISDNHFLKPVLKTERMILRRQDLPASYVLNGAIYLSACSWMREHKALVNDETIAFVMPNERSHDIDTEFDFKLLELMIRSDQ